MSENAPATETSTAPAQAAPKQEMFSADYVQQLRQESAGYRTRLESAVEEAKTATRTEVETEFSTRVDEVKAALTQANADLEGKTLELMKLNAALDAGVPDGRARAFAKLLQGATEDELKSHAEEAKGLFVVEDSKAPAVDYTQGTGNEHLPLNGDPLLQSVLAIVNK